MRNACCGEQIDHNFVKWSTAATTSGLTAHACFPYSGITLARVNGGVGVAAAESGLDFTYNRLLWGKRSHESGTAVMAPSSVLCVQHHHGVITRSFLKMAATYRCERKHAIGTTGAHCFAIRHCPEHIYNKDDVKKQSKPLESRRKVKKMLLEWPSNLMMWDNESFAGSDVSIYRGLYH